MPKSTKAVKVTDVREQKSWLNRGRGKYKIETKERNKTVLIVCEGQSEKYYFESFPLYGVTSRVVDLHGRSKIHLVNEAVKLQREEKADAVWCVFDMDVNIGEKEYANFDNAIHMANAKKFEVAYSNDAFELWLCLHFMDLKVTCRRDHLYESLNSPMQFNYLKKGKELAFCRNLYKFLKETEGSCQEGAIKRAEALHLELADKPFHQQNPVTTVYRLVKYLNANQRVANS